MHLIFLVPGLLGVPSHMEAMRESLETRLSDSKFKIIVSAANSRLGTLEGIRACATRLYAEVTNHIDSSITQLSFVGYSMGGLVCRYLFGILEKTQFWEVTAIVPGFFSTFATPHLGAVFWNEGLLYRLVNGAGRIFLGPSGRELMSTGSRGVVAELADPNGSAYRGLATFPSLYLFVNGVEDRTVRFWSGFITNKSPFEAPDQLDLVYYDLGKVPFVVDLERTRHVEHTPSLKPEKGTAISLRFWLVILPIAFVGLSCVSTYATIRNLLCGWYWNWKHRSTVRAFNERIARFKRPDYNLNASTTESVDPSDTTVSHNGRAMEKVFDKAPPTEPEAQIENVVVGQGNPPKPWIGTSHFVEESTVELPLSSAKLTQMNALNKLPWQKYVVTIHGWSHALIINRNGTNTSRSEGKSLLDFFAGLIATTY